MILLTVVGLNPILVFLKKNQIFATNLRKWCRSKPKNSYMLAQLEQQLLHQQNLHPSLQKHTLQTQLHDKHQSLLAQEETYHRQRAKKVWTVKGDRNTIFFLQSHCQKDQENKITSLQNLDGSFSTMPPLLADTLLSYFSNIFSTSLPQAPQAPPLLLHNLQHPLPLPISNITTPLTLLTLPPLIPEPMTPMMILQRLASDIPILTPQSQNFIIFSNP